MKTLHVKDELGRHVPGWTFSTFKGVQVGIDGHKPRHISGWQIVAPDGCARLCEGNWQQFVPFANMVLTNHGYKANVS